LTGYFQLCGIERTREADRGGGTCIFLLNAVVIVRYQLLEKRLIYQATRAVFARNTLVLIVPAGSKLELHSFADLERPPEEDRDRQSQDRPCRTIRQAVTPQYAALAEG
jgi:hypothetical protein